MLIIKSYLIIFLKEKEKEIDVGRDDVYVFKNALYFYFLLSKCS